MLKMPALAAATLLIGMQTAAWSQDVTRTRGQRDIPAADWSGFYVGLSAGGAWGAFDLRTDAGSFTPTSYFTSPANIASINQNASGSHRASAVVPGLQVGGNLQTGSLVYGFEVDLEAFDLKGSRGAVNFPYVTFPATYSVRASADTDWLMTFRGRLGWTLHPGLLVYGTGGLALTSLNTSNSFSDTAVSAGLGGTSNTDLKTGWVVGGGLEWALARHWSLKAEYLHVDFGSVSTAGSVQCGPAGAFVCTFFGVTPSAFTTSAQLQADIARVGINYRF